uniref:P-loop containing nucleoside triphosphate hydrolase protein n=1 Tax=Moniliophthora roreri TaxID=221103 RepID=A0A0W0F5R1_MONRR
MIIESFFANTLLIPPYIAFLSLALILFHWTVKGLGQYLPGRISRENSQNPVLDGVEREPTLVAHVTSERVIQFCWLLRTIGCLVLVGLSLATRWSLAQTADPEGYGAPETALVFCFLYTTFLSLLPFIQKEDNTLIALHRNALLLVTLAVYVYRDVFPLLTFAHEIADKHEGVLLWAKVAALVLVSVAIPLFTPRRDMLSVRKEPNPEQQASLASLLTYTFLDSVIFFAYRSPKFTHGDLPPLADYDAAQHLKSQSFKNLDVFSGAKRKHVFFGLIKTFRWDYASLVLISIVKILGSFAAPISINRLLNYIETGGDSATIQPWVWIVLGFIGPLCTSMATNRYEFTASRLSVRTEAIFTQIIFEHSLRIRPQTDDKAAKDGKAEAPTDKTSNSLMGKLNNLVTTDLANVIAARDFLKVFVQMPIRVVLCIFFLYEVLGWSAFVGLAVIVACLPIPSLVGRAIHSYQREKMKRTDARAARVVEALNLMRMIKLLGWERNMQKEINEKLSIFPFENLAHELTLLCFSTVIMKQELSASKVFSTVTVMDMFRRQLWDIFNSVTAAITGKVSLDRINDFLHNTEVLDAYSRGSEYEESALYRDEIGFQKAKFTWGTERSAESSDRNFVLDITDHVVFKEKAINLIIGPTGAGKTSILMALLGEMHFQSATSPGSWFNLPRKNGVAYAAQESWIQNDTIKANILFGNPFDEERYTKVIHQCCLEHDLNLFEAGDDTEVGEMGVTLSGGQRARVTLARAIYSNAEILLLDDVFASLDSHTAKWIVNKCFQGDLVKGRTVLLVTHNLALTAPLADYVVSVDLEGRVTAEQTSIDKNAHLQEEIKKDEDHLQKADDEKLLAGSPAEEKRQKNGKLIVDEEKEDGRVRWSTVAMYFRSLTGNYPFLYYTCFFVPMVLSNASVIMQTWYLGYWSSEYENHHPSEVNVFFHLGIYGMSPFSTEGPKLKRYKGALHCLPSFGTSSADLSPSALMESIFGSTLRWLDTTPRSRIITRATQDINAIDGPLFTHVFMLWNFISFIVIQLGAVVVYSPWFILPGIVLTVIGTWLSTVYMKAQISIKREMSNARSPVLAHYGAAISGLPSIRAYGAQGHFIRESLVRIDHYSRTARTFHSLTRWIGLRMDFSGSLFATALAIYLLYIKHQNAAATGFSLNMAAGFSAIILNGVQSVNTMEVQSNSLERIQQYLRIEQEPKLTQQGEPPAGWPASGSLRVENLSARYFKDGVEVLRDLSFEVKSGERIGVVGRTGAGKVGRDLLLTDFDLVGFQSSLTLALLRGIPTTGEVYYDGLPTSSVNLDALRSGITIIPQVPELFSGTLRQNLDPFEEYDDVTLNDALRAAGLQSLQSESDENRLTLDTTVASGGSNMSVGQRQILALASAIVRGSKLLILDEATSAIDYKTDAVIQQTLRNELGKDVTLITVAHRLQTIMDSDKIMVLEDGKIVEFDTPRALVEKESKLRTLIQESDDRDVLLAMVK